MKENIICDKMMAIIKDNNHQNLPARDRYHTHRLRHCYRVRIQSHLGNRLKQKYVTVEK